MLSIRRRRIEAVLIERYWSGLRRNPATPAPDALDPTLANVIAETERDLRPPRLSDRSIEQLWRRVDARASETTRSGWSGPAIDPTARRRTGAPPLNEREEQPIMSDHTQTADLEPIPLQQRRWFRETLKFVAAAIVFITIGALLALTLRNDDDQTPAVQPSGPTPTPTMESTAPPTATTPMATATPAAVVPPAATSTRLPATATATVELPPADVQASITVGRGPADIVAGAGAIWVPDYEGGKILRIDPATNEVVARIDAQTREVAFDGSLWAIDESGLEASILQIDPATNTVVGSIPLPGIATGSTRGMAIGAGSIWLSVPDPASDRALPSVVRVDLASRTIVATITGIGALGIVATDDAVWVADIYQSNNVVRIDPATNTIVARIAVGSGPTSVVVGVGSVWVTNQDSGSVSRIDPATNEVLATIYLGPFQDTPGEHPFGIAIDEQGVWVTDLDKPHLYQIDPATNEVVATLKARASTGIVASDGSLWLTNFRSNTVMRINPAP